MTISSKSGKKQRKPAPAPRPEPGPSLTAGTEGQAVLEVLRSNLSLLGELAARYEVNRQPERPQERPEINTPQDVYNLLGPEMATLAQEQLRVLLLDTANHVLGQRLIYQGNVNSSIVRPAEVFRPAVIEQAPSIIVIHNHPSGDPTPSREDVAVTRDLTAAGKLLGISLLDHVVIAGSRSVSLNERGPDDRVDSAEGSPRGQAIQPEPAQTEPAQASPNLAFLAWTYKLEYGVPTGDTEKTKVTNINDISDLAQVLQDNPHWREIIRGILLGDELLQLPKQLAEFIKTTQENFQLVHDRLDRLEAGQARLEADVESLKEGQARLEAGQTRLEAGQENLSSRLGNIIGSDYERRAAQSARRLARLGLGIRRARVILARTAPDRNEMPELLNDATENGAVTDDEADDLLRVDIILLGQNAGGYPTYAVCEVAVTLYNYDVLRAKRRAGILQRASGITALPAVIGQSAPQETLDLADRQDVAFIPLPEEDSPE